MVKGSEICIKHQAIQHQPLRSTELLEAPWLEIGSDLFEFHRKNYLLAVDYYSRWIEIYELKEISSKNVITKLKSMFSRLGIPVKIRSDNGGCYASQKFQAFCDSNGIEHSTSSLRYPQSNGLVERCVRIVKRMWDKSQDLH